ncbi:MAG: hypothetical protein KAG66_18900, partial [Methylococcales bacterium]|nr:hypothetical protein [Methylococcales bacterium]
MVLEQGWHVMSDGSIWEVGTFTLTGSGSANFSPVEFQREFPSGHAPHLFLTVQTHNGAEAVSVRARNITEDGFQAALYEQESTQNSGHAEETVGYVAIYSQKGSGEVRVDGKRIPYVIQRLGINGGNTPVLNGILTVQEEQSQDDETDHVMDETYDVLGIGAALFAQDISSAGGNPTAPRLTAAAFPENIEWGTVTGVTDLWVDVPLSRNYQNPIVVVDLDSTDSGITRLRRGLDGGFQVRVNRGSQSGQRVHYMVAEQGIHDQSGLKFVAGRVATSSTQTKSIDFDYGFAGTPAIFSGVMTTFGSDDVETITHNIGASGFEIEMNVPGHR